MAEEQNKSQEEKEEKIEEKPKKEEKTEENKQEKVKDKTEDKQVEIPEKFKDLVKQIEELNIMDLAELVEILEKKFGVSAAAPVAVAPTEGGGGEEGESEEKSEFNLELKDPGSQKIQVIKAVREITGKGLKEAKDLVDKAPETIKENIKKDEAQEMVKKLEDAGASVELK